MIGRRVAFGGIGVVLLAAVLGARLAASTPVTASAEEVADDGLAIWPVDTLGEAESECPGVLVPSWRHSAEDTTRRYAQEMLGIDHPRAIELGRVVSDSDVFVDITAKGSPCITSPDCVDRVHAGT